MPKNDKILSDACYLAEEMYWKDFSENIDESKFTDISSEQRNKIYKLINDSPKNVNGKNDTPHATMKSGKKLKAMLIAAVLIILMTATAFSFSPIHNFIVKLYKDCSEIIFNTDESEDYLYSDFTYIPTGYKLSDSTRNKNSQCLLYLNGKKRIVIDTILNKNSKTFIDTENAKTGEIAVNETTGYYSITDSEIILIWSTGKYNHCITADVDDDKISLEEIVKIAQSRQYTSQQHN